MQHQVSQRCPNLQWLSLRDARQRSQCWCREDDTRRFDDTCCLNPAGLAAISEGCTHLRALSLREIDQAISEVSLGAVSKNCQELVELDLSGTWNEWGGAMW